jgi:hypothetical protein
MQVPCPNHWAEREVTFVTEIDVLRVVVLLLTLPNFSDAHTKFTVCGKPIFWHGPIV